MSVELSASWSKPVIRNRGLIGATDQSKAVALRPTCSTADPWIVVGGATSRQGSQIMAALVPADDTESEPASSSGMEGAAGAASGSGAGSVGGGGRLANGAPLGLEWRQLEPSGHGQRELLL